jgi:3-dehydroquinate dehydratase-2
MQDASRRSISFFTYQHESFRHHAYFSDIATGVICGLGAIGYELALQAAIENLNQS